MLAKFLKSFGTLNKNVAIIFFKHAKFFPAKNFAQLLGVIFVFDKTELFRLRMVFKKTTATFLMFK